jgi:hypothetical protein
LRIKTALASDMEPGAAPDGPVATAAVIVLTDAQHASAVRQALRNFGRLDALARNPLAQTLVVTSVAGDGSPARALQRLLRDAVSALASSPRDLKFHRALWHTYIEPAPTQELAAELLDLPFNTYRYHLARGIERVSDWLRQREEMARSSGG